MQLGKRFIIGIVYLFILVGFIGTAKADTVWTTGHHEIVDGDIYGEIWMYNDATAEILGGDVGKLETFDVTGFNMLGGEMDRLYVHNDSTVNIFGGTLYTLEATENSLVYIYAYDVTYDPLAGGYGNGWLEGTYCSDDSRFGFSLFAQDTYLHITVIPEPSTILLLILGGLLVRRSY